jgi:hypothetical protein
MSPSVGFSISPDFETHANGYEFYEDAKGNEQRYNIFQGSTAGFPRGGKTGSINFGLGNNFEMKVRDKKDTVRGERKIKLIDMLSLGTSYNLAADSLKWAPISLTTSITLFRNYRISYNAQFDLYARDTTGGRSTRINKFIWEPKTQNTDNKFLQSQSMSTSLSWAPKSGERGNSEQTNSLGVGEIFEQHSEFDPQWSLNIGYTINYRGSYAPGLRRNNIWGHPIEGDPYWSEYNHSIMQTLSFGGSLNLTEKWSISFNSGWDFTNKKISQTMFNITRDLHCWTMDFTWSPFGNYKEWSFNIRIISNMLGDVMKYDRKRTHREFYE